jgi:cation:H+ antiporter
VNGAGPTLIFFGGASVSLTASWMLVSRIERIGATFRFSEALLGLVSALAADAPEITSAISALVLHQGAVGAGIVLGSNVFHLAALIGLGAVMAGGIRFDRGAIALEGAVALWMVLTCVLLVARVAPPGAALGLGGVALLPYAVVSALAHSRWWLRPHRSRVQRWIRRAVAEEEAEIGETLRAPRANLRDALVAAVALAVVVVASVAMERAGSELGDRLHAPPIVVGGVALAVVTSLPNAVAAIYWARRGRGTATLSTAMNSNALNVAVGLVVPAVIVGLGARRSSEVLAVGWYGGMTLFTLAVAYWRRGVARSVGWTVIALYGGFLAALIVVGM